MSKNKTIKVNASIEDRMRVFANVMIDKIIEDYRNGTLKFEPKIDKLRINQNLTSVIDYQYALTS
ncbi:TPA: hypothetical protein DIV55_04740 [Patescibacteria group bacterium]|nr:hypothetical protein [Patescibacteria group bacterium]